MTFTLTGTVQRAQRISKLESGNSQSDLREVLVAGTIDDKQFEVVLRVSRDASPTLFDPLGNIALAQSVTVEVTV
ncbi:MAG: hypothetical protein IPK85_02600 [Gemmatimonadetes bacterium]|nr:hypothetical protein [Gemmatimonadota bacterium]